MYAIVDHAGKQIRIEPGQEVKVPRTPGESGTNIQLERVLLLHDGSSTLVGRPTVAGASVDATILEQGRERKIIVFKFKRRKGYRRTMGHRQAFTTLRINAINLAERKPAKKVTADGKSAPLKEGSPKPKARAPSNAAKTPKPTSAK